MLRRVLPLLALPVLLTGCCACGGLLTSRRTSPLKHRDVAVSGIDSVELRTSGELTIRESGSEHLEIEAPAATLEVLTAEVRGSTLVLGSRPGRGPWSWGVHGPIRYDLSVKSLQGIDVKGSGDVDAERLAGEDMRIDVSGSGNVRIAKVQGRALSVDTRGSGGVDARGELDEQSVTIAGSGDYDAGRLATTYTDVRITGSGSATVWAEEALTAEIMGSGDCYYYGSPRVRSREVGSGDVVSMGSP